MTSRTRIEKRKKKIERFQIILKRLVLGCIVLFLLILVTKLYSAWTNRVWGGEEKITIVVNSQTPKIYSFDPISQKVTVLELPRSLEIAASHGLGSWFAGSLYELGLQKKMGGELLRTSLQKSLGIPIDAWVASRDGVFFQDEPKAKITFLLQTLLPNSNVATNLSIIDQLNLLIKTSSSRVTTKEINPLAFGVIRKKDFGFEEEAYELTSERTNHAFTKYFRDELVFSESKTISIINTTSRAKLAQEISFVISTLGVKVIETKQSDEAVSNCTLKGASHQLSSNSARRLTRLFKCEKETSTPQGPADLELILGEEFSEKF